MADYSVSSGDAFAAFVKKSEEDEAKLQAKQSGNGGKTFTYETQQWVGLDQGRAHILRLVGNPPESLTPGFKTGPYDAHEIFFETIKDDNGDRMQLRLPCHAEDINDEHIMWRIINKVKEVEWVDDPQNPGKRKRIPKHEKTLVYDKITHGGFNPADPKEADSYRYSKGWSGQQVTIMNVIDREDSWCKDNKHTKLLSKKVTVGKDGSAYPTVGVPSYGFLSTLKKLVKVYGSWERYDIQVVKTGQMNTPYEVKNASYYKSVGVPEIDTSKLDFISLEPGLTAEEQAYERYDIAKFYSPTSYKNLKERLGKTIQEVDATFNTHFYMELTGLAEKEEKERAEKQAAEAAANPAPQAEPAPVYANVSDPAPIVESTPAYVAPQPVAAPAVAPVAEPAKVAEPAAPAQPAMATRGTVNIGTLAPNKVAALKGWMKLTDANKAQIKDVVLDATGTITNVLYTEDAATQCNCNNCMMPSPQDFLSCPICGADFE